MAIQRMFPVGCIDGTALPSLEGLAASGATDGAWDKGAVLVATSAPYSGHLTQGGTDPSDIVGLAEADGPQASDSLTKVRYVPLMSKVLVEATVSHGATAIPLADTILFREWPVTKSGSGASALWYVNTVGGPDGSTGRFRILRFKDASGTSDGRVIGVFTQDNTIYGAS